ncbi:MAG: hypothetical protein WCH20_06320 [Nitrospira sp.]
MSRKREAPPHAPASSVERQQQIAWRACQPKARRSSESAIAAEAFMNNAG